VYQEVPKRAIGECNARWRCSFEMLVCVLPSANQFVGSTRCSTLTSLSRPQNNLLLCGMYG